MKEIKIKLVLDKVAYKKYKSNKQKQGTLGRREDFYNEKFVSSYRPHKSLFKNWLLESLRYIAESDKYNKLLDKQHIFEVYVRLVEEEEMRHLAAKYKHTGERASVLSFPCEDSKKLGLPYIGDIVMCGQYIFTEAQEHYVDFKSHWCHLFIHSVLHLLGLKHGKEMENIEDSIMNICGLDKLSK